ncbi:hypothetical protein [Paenisporosarcina sp. TG-14]|uniref:hypothetical protein n=1 Tax=Paenisporosarcina sp. TG-14 TaxID=1231057 RepID=UPI0002F820FD|nr:hypothetical protein [Paenisporosarcina sp. TG-14]
MGFVLIISIITSIAFNTFNDEANTHYSEVLHEAIPENTITPPVTSGTKVTQGTPSLETVRKNEVNSIDEIEDIPEETPEKSSNSDDDVSSPWVAPETNESKSVKNNSSSSNEFFTLGSTKEEVENIMGTPTAISAYSNQWSYDFSTIEFNDQNLVTAWTDFDQKLHVSLGNVNGSTFNLDSTKQQVLNAMGTPTSISLYSNQWSYDFSTIDFNENDLVVAWTDFDKKLNVTIGNSKGDSFSLDSTKQQVIDAMGTPTSISLYSNQWSYDFSTINFSQDNLVIDWSDFDEILKVK